MSNAALQQQTMEELTGAVELGTVIAVVCDTYQVTPQQISATNQVKALFRPRLLVMYLAMHHTTLTATEIGIRLGGRPASSILNGRYRIECDMDTDPDFAEQVILFSQMLEEIGKI